MSRIYSEIFKTRREVLRSLLAEFIYRRESVEEKLDSFLENVSEREGLTSKERNRLKELLTFYLENEDLLYEHLTNTLVGWKPERLLPLDRAAILAGMTELLLGEDSDSVIYDYGTFAKKFSADRSPSFVMGVLKSFKKRLKDGERGDSTST
ncbi:MAG: hypothetical protein GXO39_07430 [Thermotogae bacterium]|nr:hypothetical protein [Thermotogota bacterium]